MTNCDMQLRKLTQNSGALFPSFLNLFSRPWRSGVEPPAAGSRGSSPRIFFIILDARI